MDIEALKAEKRRLSGKYDWAENLLRAYIDGRRDEMGIVLDEVKTPLYKAIKAEHDTAFNNLREFNGKYAKTLRNA